MRWKGSKLSKKEAWLGPRENNLYEPEVSLKSSKSTEPTAVLKL